MTAKRKFPQFDLFRSSEEPEDVECALSEEHEMRDYARRIQGERKSELGYENDAS